MKHVFMYGLIGLLICQGCSDKLAEGEDSTALRLLSVELAGSTLTKSEVNSINEVNVYVTKTDGSDYGKTPFLRFVYANSSWTSGTNVTVTADNAKVYGCYPAPSGSTVTNENQIPITPATVVDQDNFSGNTQSDYLYSGAVDATPTSRAIILKMNHALAKVSLRIEKSLSVSEAMTLTRVEILSRNTYLQKGSVSMQLTDGTLNGLTPTGSILLTGSMSLSNSLNQPNITCLVAPMNTPEPALSFKLTVQVAGVERSFTTSSVATAVKWEKGKHYIYHISVNKMGGSLTGVEIEKWKTDASPNTSIGI